MTLPNQLTLLRIILIPVFMYCMLANVPYGGILALVVFVVAALTDRLDGYLARKFNQITSFGKIMDPLADKLLVISAFLIFVAQGRMPSVAAMLILAREFAVTSLRVVAVGEGKIIAAGTSGKIKTVVQLIAAIYVLLDLGNYGLPNAALIEQAVLWLAAAVTLWSGIEYFYANRNVLKSSVKGK